VISPLLANIYLHHALDGWFVDDVRPKMRGRCRLIRYADDFVIVFEYKDDAERVMEVLPKRMAKYGLTVHPDKTRLTDFRSPNHRDRRREKHLAGGGAESGKPETFDLLGFTHYWGKSRNGGQVVKRKTASKRLTQTVQNIYRWCRKHRHSPVRAQWKTLSAKLRGYYSY
jgi:RNA-directed DNA polymerase